MTSMDSLRVVKSVRKRERFQEIQHIGLKKYQMGLLGVVSSVRLPLDLFKPPHSGSKKFNNSPITFPELLESTSPNNTGTGTEINYSPITFPELLESTSPNNTGTGTEINYSPILMLKESPTPNKTRTRRTK